MYNIPDDVSLDKYFNEPTGFNVPDSVLFGFYGDGNTIFDMTERVSVSTVSEDNIGLLEDDEYIYRDHFNF